MLEDEQLGGCHVRSPEEPEYYKTISISPLDDEFRIKAYTGSELLPVVEGRW